MALEDDLISGLLEVVGDLSRAPFGAFAGGTAIELIIIPADIPLLACGCDALAAFLW